MQKEREETESSKQINDKGFFKKKKKEGLFRECILEG